VKQDWPRLPADEVLRHLNSSREGLSESEARRRLEQYGQNVLRELRRSRVWSLILRHVADRMTALLAVAAAVAWATGDALDAALIGTIVFLNAFLGIMQEYRAERALAALKQLKRPQATVWRDGRATRLDASVVVPGDLIAVESGDHVPADGRLLETARLTVDESALTGESVPVVKHAQRMASGTDTVGDRLNMLFSGTTIMSGRGSLIVTETGMATELGAIANLLQTVDESQTPLQRRLAVLGNWLAAAVVAIAVVFFLVGLARGERLETMLLTAISLAVAAIPEGLPAMIAIVLALGAKRMAARQALIRSLPAVETLGSVTTICSDKTGTRHVGRGYRGWESGVYRHGERLSARRDLFRRRPSDQSGRRRVPPTFAPCRRALHGRSLATTEWIVDHRGRSDRRRTPGRCG